MALRTRSAGEEKEFVKQLTESHQFRPAELLGWMLEEALYRFGAMKERTWREEAGPQVQACLLAYMRAVRVCEPYTDVLGTAYMTLASGWGQKVLGQYFTPQPIAKMMAKLTYDRPSAPGDGRLLRACDSACGSGVMMLAFLQTVLEQEGPGGLRRWSVTGIDIDLVCARMCAVQFLANWMVHELPVGEVVVLRGDSLAQAPPSHLIVHATFEPPKVPASPAVESQVTA